MWLTAASFSVFLIVNAIVAQTDRDRQFARTLALLWFGATLTAGWLFR